MNLGTWFSIPNPLLRSSCLRVFVVHQSVIQCEPERAFLLAEGADDLERVLAEALVGARARGDVAEVAEVDRLAEDDEDRLALAGGVVGDRLWDAVAEAVHEDRDDRHVGMIDEAADAG